MEKKTRKEIYRTYRAKLEADPVRLAAHRERVTTPMRQRYFENRMLCMRQFGGKCGMCGFDNPDALQFDHVGKKTYNMAALMTSTNMAKLFDELHQCQLLCANCHALETKRRKQQTGRPKKMIA